MAERGFATEYDLQDAAQREAAQRAIDQRHREGRFPKVIWCHPDDLSELVGLTPPEWAGVVVRPSPFVARGTAALDYREHAREASPDDLPRPKEGAGR